MKTTPSQISDLYAFTRKHFVEHYDLQTELVDHLANDIEEIREESPQLSFEQARDIAFKKFGVYGFAEIIEQRQNAMNKRYWKYIWQEFKQWFSIPKVATTIVIFALFCMLFSTQWASYIFVSCYIMIIIWAIKKMISLNRQFRKRREQTEKKWLLENIIFRQATSLNFVFLSQLYAVVQFSEKILENQYLLLIFSLLFTLSIVFLYISFHVLPNKADQLLKRTYPEYSL